MDETLLNPTNLLIFWPSSKMTDIEKLHASTRFIIYASLGIYLTQRDPRIFTIGLLSIFVLVFCYRRQQRATAIPPLDPQVSEKCRAATENNPAGNRLLGRDYLASAPGCDDPAYINALINQGQPMEPQQYLFGSGLDKIINPTPLAHKDWAAGQGKFAEFLGQPLSPSKPFCKNDPSKCIASWTGRPGGGGQAGSY